MMTNVLNGLTVYDLCALVAVIEDCSPCCVVLQTEISTWIASFLSLLYLFSSIHWKSFDFSFSRKTWILNENMAENIHFWQNDSKAVDTQDVTIKVSDVLINLHFFWCRLVSVIEISPLLIVYTLMVTLWHIACCVAIIVQ